MTRPGLEPRPWWEACDSLSYGMAQTKPLEETNLQHFLEVWLLPPIQCENSNHQYHVSIKNSQSKRRIKIHKLCSRFHVLNSTLFLSYSTIPGWFYINIFILIYIYTFASTKDYPYLSSDPILPYSQYSFPAFLYTLLIYVRLSYRWVSFHIRSDNYKKNPKSVTH